MSFTGVYQHQIDAKGRTSLPSRFREVLAAQGADKLFVTTDLFDGCLQAYAPAQWTAFTQKVAALSQFDPSVRLLVRSFVAPARATATSANASSGARQSVRSAPLAALRMFAT